MDYKEIKKLIDDMGESKLDSLEIEFPDGVKISMKKNSKKEVIIKNPEIQSMIAKQNVGVPAVQVNNQNKLVEVKSTEKEEFEIIKSPMVGTFYASSAPDKPPFVQTGDTVKVGQVVCIVEAMKLMNEIESEVSGKIEEVCVKNGDMVEYGTPLFKIRKEGK